MTDPHKVANSLTEADRATCGNCKWRSDSPYINPDRGSAEFHDIMFACKRRAPVVTGGMHCHTMTIWPMVSRSDWCGEHQPVKRILEEQNNDH